MCDCSVENFVKLTYWGEVDKLNCGFALYYRLVIEVWWGLVQRSTYTVKYTWFSPPGLKPWAIPRAGVTFSQ